MNEMFVVEAVIPINGKKPQFTEIGMNIFGI